jgi:hypothetical protein
MSKMPPPSMEPVKNLDAIRAIMNLLAHPRDTLRTRFHVRNIDVIGFEKFLGINRRSALCPERFARRENPWPFHSAAFDMLADELRVLEYRCDVEDGCEAPPRQYFIELLGDLFGREFFRME